MKNTKKICLPFVFFLLSQTFFCSSFEPTTYYYSINSPVFENEVLIIQGDTITATKVSTENDIFSLNDSLLNLYRYNISLHVWHKIPDTGTSTWNDSTVSTTWLKYMEEKIKYFTISLTRIPYNPAKKGRLPPPNDSKYTATPSDSFACKIECTWENDCKYSGEIQSLVYNVSSTD